MILKPSKKLRKLFRRVNGIDYATLETKSFLEDMLDKDKCTSELNTKTGKCSSNCPFKDNICIGSKECIKCMHCYGNTVKLIITYKDDVNAMCVVQCSYSRNVLYKFITKIIRTYKKLTNKLIKYKIIYL